MSLFECLSVVFAFITGCWILLERYRSVKEKLASTQLDMTENSINRLDMTVNKLGSKLEEIESQFADKIGLLTDKFHDLNTCMVKNTLEFQHASSQMDRLARKFEDVYVGNGAYKPPARGRKSDPRV